MTPEEMERCLRHADLPVIVRVQYNAVVLSLRTLGDDELQDASRIVREALGV
ncbi:l-seryl-tRNA(Sec) selenium transferase [Megasphaera elsdenii CAG:570]|uniref:L-seryl-tRNA(Sec) selenium transferase n=2 Tax=Megasphaera elsdenii TaxID=907 RepID=R7MXG6_MEGEL|nr:l-seryl-tRNA(Sec) selenium transferase [Megasphaera elsdenii CAG:570]